MNQQDRIEALCLEIRAALRAAYAIDGVRGASVEAPSPEAVTRFEVIDHRHGAPSVGRAFVAWGCRVELSYQDAGRTLKVFVDGAVSDSRRRETP